MASTLVQYGNTELDELTATLTSEPEAQVIDDDIEQPGLMSRIMLALRGDDMREEVTHVPGTKYPSRILVMIPAHNEAQGIRDCLEGLADQALPEDVSMDVLVLADNCSDGTEHVALQAGIDLGLSLTVQKTEGNRQRKVGALNAGWALVYGNKINQELNEIQPTDEQVAYRRSVKAVLGMDADSRLAPNAVIHMWTELMSAPDIGGVMSRYTMRLPKSLRSIDPADPHYDVKVSSGEYGGMMNRWWTAMQKQDMASWLLSLFCRGGSTYVLGGQASLFRPMALAQVVNDHKLLGPWDPSTQVEDMKLTWMLQEAKWKTLVSPHARCYVDAMADYHTFRQQRLKWDSGTLELLTSQDDHHVKTRHIGFLWRQQMKMAMDLTVRVLFFTLLTIALATDQFVWNWLWLIPPVVASTLNIRLALRVPQHRPIDVVLAGTLISPEIYLWVRLVGWVQVWSRRLSVQEKDGWEAQYAAQRGDTKSKLGRGIAVIVLSIGVIVGLAIYFHDYFTSTGVQSAVRPYMLAGFVVLSFLTIFQVLAMLRQHWLLRAKHRP